MKLPSGAPTDLTDLIWKSVGYKFGNPKGSTLVGISVVRKVRNSYFCLIKINLKI